jgi:hypothetical protein
MVGMPGINVLSLSEPAQRDFFFRFRSVAGLELSEKIYALLPLSAKLHNSSPLESSDIARAAEVTVEADDAAMLEADKLDAMAASSFG